MLDDITLFIHIVNHRSLNKCAQHLKMSPATLTRRLKLLEQKLGHRLIHRSARKFQITNEGQTYFDAYVELVHQFEETQRSLDSQTNQLSGPLKVMAPTTISVGLLQPMWSGFVSAYPEITLDLQLSNETQDFHLNQADMALRIGPQQTTDLFQKKLATIPTILVASPDYLDRYGTPNYIENLKDHRLIKIGKTIDWHLKNSISNIQKHEQTPASLLVNDISLACQFARDDHGIALIPLSECHSPLETGNLVQILPEWQGPDRDMFAIWHSKRLLSGKSQVLRDYMINYCQSLDFSLS